MPNEVEVTQKNLNLALGDILDSAATIISKEYLDKLENYEIINPSAEDIDTDISECGRFFKLSKLVMNKEENFLNKLTTIVNVASSIDCSISTIIRSDGQKIDYYFGIISKNVRDKSELSAKKRDAYASAFKGALSGNLVGSELEEVEASYISAFGKNFLSK